MVKKIISHKIGDMVYVQDVDLHSLSALRCDKWEKVTIVKFDGREIKVQCCKTHIYQWLALSTVILREAQYKKIQFEKKFLVW